ncbi:hypothetical protein J696_03882 [Acinetobacter baumannii 1428368]|nr:hypothetical protein J696_03882 [Acinetobacter baumannii 1428368]
MKYKQVQNYLKSERQDVQNQDEIYKAILHLRDQLNHRSLTRKQRRSNQKKSKKSQQLSEQNQ